MNDMQAEGFRTKVFGGFNRQDVMEHIKDVYEQLGRCRAENEALRERCEALEAQLQVAQEVQLRTAEDEGAPEDGAAEARPAVARIRRVQPVKVRRK